MAHSHGTQLEVKTSIQRSLGGLIISECESQSKESQGSRNNALQMPTIPYEETTENSIDSNELAPNDTNQQAQAAQTEHNEVFDTVYSWQDDLDETDSVDEDDYWEFFDISDDEISDIRIEDGIDEEPIIILPAHVVDEYYSVSRRPMRTFTAITPLMRDAAEIMHVKQHSNEEEVQLLLHGIQLQVKTIPPGELQLYLNDRLFPYRCRPSNLRRSWTNIDDLL